MAISSPSYGWEAKYSVGNDAVAIITDVSHAGVGVMGLRISTFLGEIIDTYEQIWDRIP